MAEFLKEREQVKRVSLCWTLSIPASLYTIQVEVFLRTFLNIPYAIAMDLLNLEIVAVGRIQIQTVVTPHLAPKPQRGRYN
jgi:hypothetical protein